MTCDFLVVMAGTVTRTFPIPGISEEAFSLLHVAEGPFAIRDRVPTSFDRGGGGVWRSRAQETAHGHVRGRWFSGVESFGELLFTATALRKVPADRL